MPTTHTTLGTKNKKLSAGQAHRGVVATYRTMDSCPLSCPFNPAGSGPGGCYADFWRIRNIAEYGDADPAVALKKIRDDARPGALVRHHVVGDMGSDGTDIDWDYVNLLDELAGQRPDTDQFTYTHYWDELGDNPFSWIAVNASCEDFDQVNEALEAGYEAVIVLDDGDPRLGNRVKTINGFMSVVQCPAEYRDVSCDDCRLCAKTNRTSIVAFTPHGNGKNKVKEAINE